MADPLSTSSDLVQDAYLDRTDGGDPLVTARIDGEINLHNSPALRADLLRLVKEQKPRRVDLDLAGVPYMDSSAIAVLVETLKAVRGDGGAVRLTRLQPRVRGLLEIARLDTIFDMQESGRQE
jgi:anti-sigma B factor antagonist